LLAKDRLNYSAASSIPGTMVYESSNLFTPTLVHMALIHEVSWKPENAIDAKLESTWFCYSLEEDRKTEYLDLPLPG
jgi:hypothetical protein